MQITKTRKALIAVTALVLVGLIVAVAAICMPGFGSTLPTMDNTVADSGSGADTVSTVSASATAPAEDGTVANQLSASEATAQGYTIIDGTEGKDFSVVRNNTSGKYILMNNITVTEPSQVTFNGELNGNGYAIEITFGGDERKESPWGGLFGSMSGGSISNLTVNVTRFNYRTQSGSTRNVGVLLGTASGGTISNVCVNLNYEGTGVDSYFADPAGHKSGTIYLNFGVIAGYVSTIDIKNVTINNNKGLTTYTQSNDGFANRPTFENSVATYIGKVGDGGTVNITDCTLAGTGIRNVQHVKGSYGTHKKYSGGVIGNIENGTVNVTRFDMEWLATWDTVTGSNLDGNDGLFYGATGQNGHINVKDLYYNSKSVQTWVAGDAETWNAYIAYDPADISVSFDKENPGNVIFATQFAEIDSSDLLYSINTGSTETKVYSVLAADGTEKVAGSTAYVSVPASGYNTSAKGSFTLKKMTVGAEATVSYAYDEAQSAYTATKVYDAQNISAPTVTVNGTEVEGVWSGAGVNVGTYDFTLLETDTTVGDYQYVIRGDKHVFVDETTGTSHKLSYQSKVLKYTITPADLQLTFGKIENSDIIYKDSADSINKYFQVTVANGTLYGEINSWDIASAMVGEVAYDATTAAGSVVTVTVNEDSIVLSDGNGNYNITWQNTSAQSTVQKLVLSGAFSGLENLVYSAQAQTPAVFTVSGIEADGIIYKYTVKDETEESEVVNAGTYTVTATAVDPSIELTDNVTDFVVSPYKVTITAKADRPTSHVYNSGVVSVDDLFNIPVGLGDDGELALSLSATKDGVDAAIELVGEYKVTASLADGQDNYTADSVSVDYSVTPYVIEIGVNAEIENSMVYDGAALTEDEMKALFVAPKTVEGADFVLSVSADSEVLNAGTYTITATIENIDGTMYGLKEDVTVEFTVEQATVDGEITAPENSVYDGSEKFATFEFADGYGMFGNDEVILSYATEGGQGVTQVVSAGTYTVSAALPAFAAGKSNYKWANDSIATKDIVIYKAPVTIQNVEDVTADYSGVAFTGYESLFTAPDGVNNEGALTLSYSVTKGEEAVEGGIVNAGVYAVTATLADNGTNANYEASAVSVIYTVTPVTVEITWSGNDYTYTGAEQTVSAKYAAVSGAEVELAVSFGEGVVFKNAGSYTATASFAEGDNADGNYVLPEVVSADYQIKKADSVIYTDDVETVYTYTGELQTVTGATLNHSEAELVYSKNTFTTVAEGNGMDIYVSVEESANYYGASTVFTITVNKALPEVAANVTIPAEGLFTSSEMPAISADATVEGAIVWDTEVLTEGENSYAWTFTPVDTENYEAVTGSETLTVKAVAFDRIEIIAEPSKVNYEYGDKFDKTGMVVEAVYNDGSREAVEDYTVADAYLTTLDENQITVTYNEKTAVVTVNVVAKEFELAYSDLTVVKGEAFELTSIAATIAGTEGNTVSLAGVDYTYSVVIAYADGEYSSDDPVGTTYALNATLTVDGLDAQNYVSAYTATLKVIATPMTGSWANDSVTGEYNGGAYEAVFNADNELSAGVDFEIQYALKGTDVWTTEAPVSAGEYVAKVVSKNDGYSADRLTTATVTISKKSVTISASGVENGVYNGETVDPATLFNAPSGVNDEGTLTLVYTITKGGAPVDEIKDAGTYKVVANLKNADGNYTASACEVTYEVSPAPVTVTWPVENSVVFSGAAYEPAVQAEGLFGQDVISVTYAANDGSSLTDGKARNAGSYTATAVLPSDNYAFASGVQQSFAFEITKVTVSIELKGDTVSVEYGDGYAWDLNDFYGNVETNSELLEAYLAWSMQSDLTGIETASAGTKYEAAVELRIRYAEGEDLDIEDADNFDVITEVDYIVVYVEVVAKKITVTATNANATYDGEKISVDELLAMFELGGVEANVTVNDTSYASAEITNVGAYTVVVASSSGNYEFIGDTDATFTVNAADITDVIVTGYSGTFDKVAHGAVVNASATTVDDSAVAFTYATSVDGVYGDAPEFIDADTYTVYYKATAANHNEFAGSFTVTITKASVELPEIASKTYNGEKQTATVAESTLYTVTENEGGTNAGNYDVTIKLNDDANYAWASGDDDKDGIVTLTFTIEKVANAWTVMPSIENWTYDETASDPKGEALYGEVSFAYQTAEGEPLDEKPANAGSYKLVVTVTESANYAGLEETVDFTIAKADYVMSGVTFENASKVYNGNTQSLTVRGTLPDGVTVSYSDGIKDAGSITITATFATSDPNYNAPAPMTAKLTIRKATLTVAGVKAADKTYDGNADIVVTGMLSGVISGDEVELTIGGTASDKNAGMNKPVTVYANISGIDSANYDLEKPENATVNISKVALTVSATAHPREYDGTTSVVVTGYLIGVVYGDNVNLTISGTMADKNVGINKPVTVNAGISGNDVGNYELAETGDLTVTITSKAIEVVWGELTFEYDGTSKVPTATADTGIDGETVEITVSGAKTEPGKYVAVAKTDNENYILMGSSETFSIVRKEVAAQFTVGYGEITVNVEGDGEVEYSVDGGAWTALPGNGKITVKLAASWAISLRFKGETNVVSSVVYTSASNVVTYLENNLSDNAIENKEAIDTAKAWLENAVGDKSAATTAIEAAEKAYNAAKDELSASVENAFKATANMTSRAVAATVAIVTAVSGLGLAVGAIALRRKGGKKNEK